jgi:hypothetical protein
MSWGWTVALFVGLFAWDRFWVWRGARRLRQIHTTMYDGGLVPTTPQDHPDVDHAFYDATQSLFEREGFTKLADLELLSHTRTHPSTRTFIRVLIDEAATTNAAIYHLRFRGMAGLVVGAIGANKTPRVFEVETEMDDGHFVCTSMAKGAGNLTVHSDIHRDFLDPQSTTVGTLVARHRERLREYLARHPGTQPRALRTIEELCASGDRQQALKKAHRAGLGNAPTRDELHAIGGPTLGGAADSLADEIERQRKSSER